MIKLRPFKNSDATTVASWVASEREFYIWSAGRLGEYPATSQTLLDLASSIADDPRQIQMVAYDEKGIFCHVLLKYPTEDDSVIRFCFVIVDIKRRGQGLGKATLKMLVSYAHDYLGADKITLGVFSCNPMAYNSYLSAGFYETGEVTKKSFMGEEWACVEMENYNPDLSYGKKGGVKIPDAQISEIIENNAFAYAFQPIVEAKTGEIYGYEALMRAESVGRSISPYEILRIAGDDNRLYEIEKDTMFNVMARYESCQREFVGRKIFINSIPGYFLTDSDYAKFKEQYGKYFCNMTVEITERAELDQSKIDTLIMRSRHDGFTLAIDNYGTGFSNAQNLLKFYPNCVKLDRLLIANIDTDPRKQHFVQSIIEFAHANHFQALAEGIETNAEFNTLMRMGIDLLQGFYISYPTFDVINCVRDDLRELIKEVNQREQSPYSRRVYIVSKDEKDIPLVRLALEGYSGISVSKSKIMITGNVNYSAEMSIKIEDGTRCELTLKDVCLEGFMQLPCLELGKDVELTLIIEGENRMRKLGIYVPESASLKIIGSGNIGIRAQGLRCYGIGNIWDAPVGKIEWNGTGSLDVLVEADEGIGIGGGIAGRNSYIKLSNGVVRVEPASRKSIGIGCVKGNLPIVSKDCTVQVDIKTATGIGIGCADENQSTWFTNSKVNIIAAGSKIACIGNLSKTAGNIEFTDSEISIRANGEKLYLIGANEGDLHLRFTETNIDLRSEGAEVCGIGTRNMHATVVANHTNTMMRIVSSNPITFGAQADKVIYRGGTRTMSVNE